jgi:hypothetical protein
LGDGKELNKCQLPKFQNTEILKAQNAIIYHYPRSSIVSDQQATLFCIKSCHCANNLQINFTMAGQFQSQ